MFGISGVEFILILLFAFLILGPDKLPEMAKTAGKAIARFRDAQKDMNEVLKENDLVDSKTGQAITNPVDMIDRVAKVAADGKGEEVAQKVASAATAAATSVIKPQIDEIRSKADVSGGSDVKAAESAHDDADGPVASADDQPKAMSFAERKARYERERAERARARASEQGKDEEPAAEGGEQVPEQSADAVEGGDA